MATLAERLINIFEHKKEEEAFDSKAEVWDRAIAIVRQIERQTTTVVNQPSVTYPNFEEMLSDRISKICDTLASKGNEYASNDNRYHNFDKAGIKRNCSPEQALKGMLVKHEVSIDDMVEGRIKITSKMIDEKIGDNINYLILLEGLFRRKL